MKRQSQWLFEAPFAPNVTQYNKSYTNPKYYGDSELTDDCLNRTSDCPPNGTPTDTISDYITHATKVSAREKIKIRRIADNIIGIANQGSQSIKVCIVGHADKDPRGENFERNISSQRAVQVMNELTSAINNASILSKVSWKLVCAGKDNPVVPFNKPLAQRIRNRRVEIFLNASPPPPRKEEPPTPVPPEQKACDSEGRKFLQAGVWNSATTLSVTGGQSMRFFLKNLNLLGTTISIRDQFGRTQSRIITPMGSTDLEFSNFGNEPMGWTFSIGTNSDAFIVSWSLCSTWVPGDPPNR